MNGWGAWIRTREWRNQNPLPYHLATPHQARGTIQRGTAVINVAPSGLCCLAQDRREARSDDRSRVLLLNRFAGLGAHALAQAGIGQLAQRLSPFIRVFREEAVDAMTHNLPVGADRRGYHGFAGRHHLEKLVGALATFPASVVQGHHANVELRDAGNFSVLAP